jgi:Ca2+-transporting ATPase
MTHAEDLSGPKAAYPSGETACLTPLDQLEDLLDSDLHSGLESPEAQIRLDLLGPNELEGEKKTSLALKLFNQFKDFLILILIAAAAISAALGETIDALIIFAVVLINAVLGAIQENQAEKALDALKKMTAVYARIIRGGETLQIPSSRLVPGDLVQLEAGDVVPADIRLFESVNLKANESALTGESVPVDKDAYALFAELPDLGDRQNMVFSGMEITYGRGAGLVVSTGQETEIGRIADRLKQIETEMTPLQVNLNRLGKVIGLFCLLICAVIFGVGLLQGGKPLPLFMAAISLAVAAIPEGLPAVVTILLALGMKRMARENAIVKRLLAVETLGSVNTICSDKTGTLTQNEMTVTRLYADQACFSVTGAGYSRQGEIRFMGDEEEEDTLQPLVERMLTIGALCNDAVLVESGPDGATSMIGDPTEGAILTAVAKGGLSVSHLRSSYPLIWEKPFDSGRKMMSVGCLLDNGRPYSLTKGAPDNVLLACDHEMTVSGIIPMTDERRRLILEQNSAFARQALRVLAFAFKIHQSDSFEKAEEAMVFSGLMGMIDPPRPEAKEAIEVCHRAGIDVVMITGDHEETAAAIANELQLRGPEDGVLTGRQLEVMDDQELFEKSESTSVYARVSPEHKVRIVEALKRAGRIVSMTGDGVNDAPALKRADIGVAMGITGTEVAKGAADMILTDDNFGTIVKAVEEGRVIYANIRKVVGFLLSCNVGEILVIFLTTMLFGPAYAPLIPVQLLWLNLVTDSFPALALGREQSEQGVMLRPPRGRNEKILNRPMLWSIVFQSIAIFLTVFAAFNLGRYFYPDLLAGGSLATHFTLMPQAGASPSWGAHTYAFVALVLSELLRVYSARSERLTVFKQGLFSNKSLNRAVLLSLALTLAVVYIPLLDRYFRTIPLVLRDWGIILLLVLAPFISGELFKVFYFRREDSRSDT